MDLFQSISDGWRLTFAVALLFINAFFVAVEFGLVRVRQTRLKELADGGSVRARDAMHIHERLDSYLSACQLGVTAASLGLGWVGEPVVAAFVAPIMGPLNAYFPGVDAYVHAASLVMGFVLITFLHITVGEQAPKILAIQRSEQLVLQCSFPLRIFHALAWPFITVLNRASNALCRWMGVDPHASHTEVHSGEELKLILNESREAGSISRAAGDVVTRALDFSHRMVREVMVPRGDVVFLNTQRPLSYNLQLVTEAGFTRFPLCDGDLDHIRGMVHLRDILEKRVLNPAGGAPTAAITEVDLKNLARKAKFMPEQMTLSNALKEFQRTRTHQAIVVDEYGGAVGLLTLEDVLEALVGPIQDEFDEEAPLIEGLGKGVARVDGSAPLAEVNTALGLNLQDPHNGTIGGHLTTLLGRIAQVGDRLRLGSYDVVVEKMSGLAVGQVCFIPRPDKRPTPEDAPVTEDTPRNPGDGRA